MAIYKDEALKECFHCYMRSNIIRLTGETVTDTEINATISKSLLLIYLNEDRNPVRTRRRSPFFTPGNENILQVFIFNTKTCQKRTWRCPQTRRQTLNKSIQPSANKKPKTQSLTNHAQRQSST